MLGHQFTHAGYLVIPFGYRLMGATEYTGAAHIKGHIDSGPLVVTISFSEQTFPTEHLAREHAQKRVKEEIDSGRASF